MHTSERSGSHRPGRTEDLQSTKRRERTMEAILGNALPLRLADLSRAIVDQESQRSLRNADGIDPDRLEVLLHHVDLPKLQARGAIEYDPSRRLVR